MKNKKIKIAAFIALFSIVSFTASAQNKELKVGTNPTIKEASAVFEVESANKGALLPRVALTSTIVAAPITAPANALTVFNTATAGTAPNAVTPGYYYWSTADSKWVRLVDKEADLRLVGLNNHITQDAGVGNNGTSAGTGFNNIGIGSESLSSITDGWENIAIGYQTLTANEIGSGNLAIGRESLASNTTGSTNLGIGVLALNKNIDGIGNIGIGHSSLTENISGVGNNAVGFSALGNNLGDYNTAFGYSALHAKTTGDNNVAIGHNPGFHFYDGSDNIFIGNYAGQNLNSGDGNIFIGKEVQPNISLIASNQLNIGNWIYGDNGKIGVGTDTAIPSERLDVGNGNVRVRDINTNTGLTTDNIVVADANGVLKTVAASSFTSTADLTKDAWIDNPANTRVELGTQSDGITARPAGTEFVATDAGRVGIGTANPTDAKLVVNETIIANPATAYSGASSILNINSTTASTQRFNALNGQIITDPANSVNHLFLVGNGNGVTHSGSGNITGAFGAYNRNLQNNAASVITDNIASYNQVTVTAGVSSNITGNNAAVSTSSALKQGTIAGMVSTVSSNTGAGATIAYGYFSNTPSLNNVDNYYAFSTNPNLETASGSGNRFAFYSNANVPSYLKGKLGIGTAAGVATNQLHVSATTDPVRIEGLATGLTTDNIVVADANGVLKTVAKSTFAADLRLVGANNHITQDAGVGGNGTSVGTGTHLVAIGASALSSNTSGSQSVAIGTNAMLQSTTATQTVAMGHNALRSNTTGNNNVAIGWNALFNNITGNKSVAVGKSAMSTYTGTGEGQIALGYEALNGLTTGTANIGIGFDAMRGLTTGNNNIAIGEKTLTGITTASNNNIAIGYTAGNTLTSGSNNILIGNAVTPNISTTGSNQLNINNWIYGNNGNIGVGAAAINPSERLDIGNGNVRVRDINTNTGAASDNIVVADANGVLKTVAATNFNNNWKLTGNAGTNPYNPANGTDFLGTTDATDFQIKVGTTAPYNNIMRVKNAQGHVQFGNWLDIAVSPMVQNADHFTSNGSKLDAPANFAVQNNFAASDLPASAQIINGSRSAAYLNASSDKTFYGDMNYTEISNAGYTGQISANYNQLRLASGATYTAATTNGVIAGGQNLLSINAGATLNGSSGNGSVAGFSFYTNAGTVNGAAAGMQSRTSNSGTFNGTYAGLQGIISSGNTFNGQVYGAQSNISAGIFNNITGAALIGVDATITGGTFAANTSTYGLRSNVTAANIRNGYGLYIEDVAGTVSQQGIYQVGTNDINNLAGSTRIGSTLAPSNTLHVTAAANPVRFEGLQAGASTDNIVVADANGVLKTVAASTSAAIRTETANYAALATDETILVDATSGTVTVTLPATPTVGKRYNVKKIDASANAATVSGNGNNIDGNATISGTLPFQGWVMQFDGDNWFIISRI